MVTDTESVMECKSARKCHGFTLIELMVVVAIIAILGMIALPEYQKFTRKSKLATAFAELAGGKASADAWIAEHSDFYGVSAALLGLPERSRQCQSIRSNVQSLGHLELVCTLTADPFYGMGEWDVTISLLRDSDTGVWTCHSMVPRKDILPAACRS